MPSDDLHQSHPEILKRLKRADGHLHKVMSMMAEGRPCADLAQQLHAVEQAIRQAKRTLIQDHIDHCLDRSVRQAEDGGSVDTTKFKKIVKYL